MTTRSNLLAMGLTLALLPACKTYHLAVDAENDGADGAADRAGDGLATDDSASSPDAGDALGTLDAFDGAIAGDERPDRADANAETATHRQDASIDAAVCPPAAAFSAADFCSNVGIACGFGGVGQYASTAACLAIYTSYVTSKQYCLTLEACRATEWLLQFGESSDFFCGNVAPAGSFCP
jgi:hypothetical protein